MTKRTAISLPDDLFADIERARKRARKDRSTWIQEAVKEHLKKRTEAEEVEAYFAAYERQPLDEDALSFIEWGNKNIGKIIDSIEARGSRRKKRAQADRTR